jgi:hypothetical protein
MTDEAEGSLSADSAVQDAPGMTSIKPSIPMINAAGLRTMSANFSEKQRSLEAWMLAKMPGSMLAHILAECEKVAGDFGYNECEFKFWIDSIVDLFCNAAFNAGFKDRKDVRQSCAHHFDDATKALMLLLRSRGFKVDIVDIQRDAGSLTGDRGLWLKVSW